MSKRKRTRQFPQQQAEPFNSKAGPAAAAPGDEAGFGKRGYVVMAAALILIALGYLLLEKADPAGTNIYAALSPAVLLSGYLLIPAALFVHKDPSNS